MYYSNKLKKFKQIKHCFFSKKGGYSKGIYKSLNCGEGSKDNKKNVKKNLILIAKKMRIKKNNLFLMHQTHRNETFSVKFAEHGGNTHSENYQTRRRLKAEIATSQKRAF